MIECNLEGPLGFPCSRKINHTDPNIKGCYTRHTAIDPQYRLLLDSWITQDGTQSALRT